MRSTHCPTEAEIQASRSPRGGWSREQLEEWGVPWPPAVGWKRALIERGLRIFGVPTSRIGNPDRQSNLFNCVGSDDGSLPAGGC